MPTTLDQEILAELEALGSEQTRKTYRRHGITGTMFGVSYAHLGKLQKRLKKNHDLACALWASENHDARILATMIADPAALTDKQAEAWARDLENYVQAGALANLVARSPLAQKKAEKWLKAKSECLGSAGWAILSVLAANDSSLPDDYFAAHLETIAETIHQQKNRVRYAMNGAVIGIGLRNAALKAKALAAAARIGKVEIDHGDTDCKTPDAATYIEKASARKRC